MADISNLEKMGRELKCPICLIGYMHLDQGSMDAPNIDVVPYGPYQTHPLHSGISRPDHLSLLKSAVSIGCNHVFCKSCILESMKRVSDCPVCKVSFRKREVRPAPHMDNLVAVFKSMEVTSGFNIFTTQVAPSTTNTGDAENSDIPKTLTAHQGRSRGNRPDNKSKQKNEKVNNRMSKRSPAMPRFPAKKRVHVTPYPISETPLRPENASKTGNGGIELEANKDIAVNKKVDGDKQQDTLFPPFFWMRERNEDDDDSLENPSSQDTAGPPQPYNAPCFSDIKDSDDDDECPIKMTTKSKHNDAEVFDSELFEWTQRACSPELCSTPLNTKTAGRNKLNDAIHGIDCREVADLGNRLSNDVSPFKSVNIAKSVQADNNGKTRRMTCAKKGSLKRRRRPKRCPKTKNSDEPNTSSGSLLCEISTEVIIKSGAAKASGHEKEDIERMKPPSQGNRSRKSYSHGNDVEAQASKELSVIKSKVLPASTCTETSSMAQDMQYYTRKRGREPTLQPKRKHLKESLNETKLKVVEEAPDNSQNQECQKVIAIPHVSPSKQTEYFQGCENNTDTHHQDATKNKVGELRGKGRKYHSIDTVLDDNANKVLLASEEIPANKIRSVATKRVVRTVFTPNNRENSLRKCGNLQLKVRCAFCHSSDDTEESGEMMHYFDGKPVAADYNGGSKVIHSHKHCTEWAPDVYFEGYVAVNLATELARSRRIKCSCCGIKGAALGCYEKNCRKSFHFTCAKLVPQCRWDDENFVMLCSLHSSSILPKEASESQKQKEQRPKPKEKSRKYSISRNSQDMSQKWTWPSSSPCKWVICCSALTAAEKEIVSEFTRLTGVSISKTWSLAVTHVITSTDANGACKRTLKFLMGVLEGKWILSIEWIKACLEAMRPVDEEKFEIAVDVHGASDGPRLGRIRIINKEPKLFSDLNFYLSGEFMPAYKGYLQDLIASAGGTVLQRKPITRDQAKLLDNSPKSATIIIYSLELPENCKCGASSSIFECRRAEAQALAYACGAEVATNLWIMDSIAASKHQPLIC